MSELVAILPFVGLAAIVVYALIGAAIGGLVQYVLPKLFR